MSERGVSLVLVLLVTSLLAAIGLGLALVVATHLMAEGNYRRTVTMLGAAEAGIELAAHDLAMEPDWDAVLRGLAHSSRTDGLPSGVRPLPGNGSLDLDTQTNLITCGRASGCSDAQITSDTRERPWGPNNPRWRLYAYGSFGAFGPFVRPGPYYLLVWVTDDGRESDGDPGTDGGGADQAGRGVLRARADVFGGFGARKAVEAELARVCWKEGGGERCQPGIRVQSWREIRQVLP